MVDPASITGSIVRFGATVVVEDDDGNASTWRIVGEDELDVALGWISYKSPIGQALIGKDEGDEVVIHAPSGPRKMAIVEVRYR